MEMKQNLTFFHETHSNLISFSTGHKILEYFNDFYNWHLFIAKVSTNKYNKIKLNRTYANLTVLSLFTTWYTILFLDKVYLKNER